MGDHTYIQHKHTNWEKGRYGLGGNMCDLAVSCSHQVFSSVSSKLEILWDRTVWLAKDHFQANLGIDESVNSNPTVPLKTQLFLENMFIIPFFSCSSEKGRGRNSTEKHNMLKMVMILCLKVVISLSCTKFSSISLRVVRHDWQMLWAPQFLNKSLQKYSSVKCHHPKF